jgi:hypothetical protein
MGWNKDWGPKSPFCIANPVLENQIKQNNFKIHSSSVSTYSFPRILGEGSDKFISLTCPFLQLLEHPQPLAPHLDKTQALAALQATEIGV